MSSGQDLTGADLPALFPGTSPEQLDRIRNAADRLRPAAWSWFEEHAALSSTNGPGLHYSLIGAVSFGDDPDDQIELELCVGRVADTADVVVSASVGVWCWCPTNHNMHYVRDVETVASSSEELTTAIENATDLIVQWRETAPRDPERWRADEGLPLRRS